MHLYFVVFKNKKDNDYKLFNNTLFDDEKKAEHFELMSKQLKKENQEFRQKTSDVINEFRNKGDM